mmetsp:Transcript_39678/g.96318  ORF Transcript_39678/g.96318 Transcript_39678/m.96318 type:complete len:288 (+) Transcript_39678:373-1236(+)
MSCIEPRSTRTTSGSWHTTCTSSRSCWCERTLMLYCNAEASPTRCVCEWTSMMFSECFVTAYETAKSTPGASRVKTTIFVESRPPRLCLERASACSIASPACLARTVRPPAASCRRIERQCARSRWITPCVPLASSVEPTRRSPGMGRQLGHTSHSSGASSASAASSGGLASSRASPCGTEMMSPLARTVEGAAGRELTWGAAAWREAPRASAASARVAPRGRLRICPLAVKTKTRAPSSSCRTSCMNSCAQSRSLHLRTLSCSHGSEAREPPSLYAQCAAAPNSAT